MKWLAILLLMLMMLAGCEAAALVTESRTVAVDLRNDMYSSSMLISWVIKWEELPDVAEISDAAVIAVVTELTEAKGNRSFGSMSFHYTIEPIEILFDETGTLTVGGSVPMTSAEGAFRLADLVPKLDYTGRVNLPAYTDDSHWLLSTSHDATPIEVGRTYLLFLTADGDSFTESGYRYLWEVIGDRLVRSDGLTRWYEEEYTLDAVRGVIAARTGRVGEIGYDVYIDEVNAREAAELEAARAALRERADAAAKQRTGKVVPIRKRRIVYTIPYDRYGDDTLAERLADCEAAAAVKLTAMIDRTETTSFVYSAEIVELFYDREDALTVGDTVNIHISSAVVEAWRMQEEIGFTEYAVDEGILQDGYSDGDYVTVMTPGTIPAEVGKTYFILLHPPALEALWDYYDCSGAYFFEYDSGRLYTGDGRKNTRADVKLSDITAAIAEME